MFSTSSEPIHGKELILELANEQAGATVVFEGWVRNHNQGNKVQSLEYQIYHELALKEGERILKEATERFSLHSVKAVHREGHLFVGEVAVWIGATASHRDDAFKATRYIIDEIKKRLPVWKKEHYQDQEPTWVFCKDHIHHVHFQESDYYKKQSSLIDQNKLRKAKVLVIGAGGLGCPALLSLATAGVGKIQFVDFDRIHISNIHRQPLFTPHLVGEKKSVIAEQRLKELNPFIEIKGLDVRVESSNVLDLISGFDLILDCTDNAETKFLLHDACFQLRIPLISASVYKTEGQLRTFLPGSEYGCLRCHLSETPDDSLLGNCNDFGVTGATTSVIGSFQASEAIAFISTNTNASLRQMILFDVTTLTQLKIQNKTANDCPTCQGIVSLAENDLEVSSNKVSEAHFIDIRELADHELPSQLVHSKQNILFCHRGIRSKKLVRALRSQGHKNVYSLRGGACSL